MTRAYTDEELPLPLLHRTSARPNAKTVVGAPLRVPTEAPLRRDYRESRIRDRLSPASAGALMGLLAGAAGLGVVHAMHVVLVSQGAERLTASIGLPSDVALPAAYLVAAVAGAAVGSAFAGLTKHLRRFLPLMFWAIVFFASLTMLLLAGSAVYGHGFGVSVTPAILVASVVYAVVVSLELPLRKRG